MNHKSRLNGLSTQALELREFLASESSKFRKIQMSSPQSGIAFFPNTRLYSHEKLASNKIIFGQDPVESRTLTLAEIDIERTGFLNLPSIVQSEVLYEIVNDAK